MTVSPSSPSTSSFASEGYLSEESSTTEAARVKALPAQSVEGPVYKIPGASDEFCDLSKIIALNKWATLIACMEVSKEDAAAVRSSFCRLVEPPSSFLTKKQQWMQQHYLDSLHKRVSKAFLEGDFSRENSEEVLCLVRQGFAQMAEWTRRANAVAASENSASRNPLPSL